ncbi:MAG: (Fe-S)-binding protein [Euryarchaeota archaeon]|nr:(Fe-S)-binding protein [Euryarchaeota archaeon]
MGAGHLTRLEGEMNTCIRCAYCFEKCPVFNERGWDSDGARGKVILSYGLLTGQLKPSKYVADKMFRCTCCRDCIERCPSNVNVIDIVSSARADLVASGFAGETHKQVVENIKKTGNIYGDAEVVSPLKEGETPLFLGCQYLSRPNKTKKYIAILEKLGIHPEVQKEVCCGFPMEILGFKAEFESHKEKFSQFFPHKGAIALCPTCTVFLKEGYGLDAKHVLQVISEKIPEAKLGLKVTYHDPCDFSRGLKIIDEPRKILKKLGVEIVEMKDSKVQSACCGGGGGILMSDPSLSDRIAKNRIRQAIETGADTLITSCPTCEQVLKKAATDVGGSEGKNIAVRNIEDIIWMGVK